MKYLFANWKMYLTHEQSVTLAQQLSDFQFSEENTKVAVFPTMLSFLEVHSCLAHSPIKTGVQNVAWTPQGAYTGAISALLSKEAGANFTLVGHSERRHVFGEDNDAVRKKIEAALDVGLTPILCIGETAKDKEDGKIEYRLKKQLIKALEGLQLEDNQLIVAYEPVWAISNAGVGEACDPVVAEERHAFIKEEISRHTNAHIPVIYGGSVNEKNVVAYISCKDIDGVLVGSASTTVEGMSGLIEAINKLS